MGEKLCAGTSMAGRGTAVQHRRVPIPAGPDPGRAWCRPGLVPAGPRSGER